MDEAAAAFCELVGLVFLLLSIGIWRRYASHVMLLFGGAVAGGWLALGAKILS